jgi:hypothetical protein
LNWRAKVELFEEIRREYAFGVGTIAGTAKKLGVHRRMARGAIHSALPALRKNRSGRNGRSERRSRERYNHQSLMLDPTATLPVTVPGYTLKGGTEELRQTTACALAGSAATFRQAVGPFCLRQVIDIFYKSDGSV